MSTLLADVRSVELAEPTDQGMVAFAAQFRSPSRIPRRLVRQASSPLVLLQPHPDDCALSLGGTLVQIDHPLHVVTVCSEAAAGVLRSTTRRIEDAKFGRLIDARVSALEFRESPSLSPRWPDRHVDLVTQHVRAAIDDGVLVAPAAVSRHVDHLGVNSVAQKLGWPLLLWEDVAFWAIYASSVEDRVLFSERNREWLHEQLLLAIDVTSHVRSKATLLSCYGSQSDELWRPLRYGWTAARELGRVGYCERLFVPASQLAAVADLLGAAVSEGPIIQYGTVQVRTAWATIRSGGR